MPAVPAVRHNAAVSLLRRPLLWTALLALAVAGVDLVVAEPGGAPGHVVISAEAIAALEARLSAGGLPPEPGEVEAALDAMVREEILVREARRLGLDEGDPVVRRRLVQKVEFVVRGGAGAGPPSEAELQAWLDGHPEDFAQPERLGLEQVFLSEARRGEALAADAAAALEALRAGADPSSLGDPFMHGGSFQAQTTDRLIALFGPELVEALEGLEAGPWSGPLASPYGLHLVRIESRTAARQPELDEVREEVLAAWRRAREAEALAQAEAALRARYTVELEGR